jgi:hypothetical protein
MRAYRCTECDIRFYVAVGGKASKCQRCAGTHDPSAQAERDAQGIALVNSGRTLGSRKQTVDIKALVEPDAASTEDAPVQVEAPKRGRKAADV